MRTIIMFTCLLLLGVAPAVHSEIGVNIETGVVFGEYNNVRIPNESGTLFSLTDDFETDSRQFYRLKFFLSDNNGNYFSLLLAPLTLYADGLAQKDISFKDRNFETGSFIKAKYRFNSYRLTYGRTVYSNSQFLVALGFTAKIRDAAIALSADNIRTVKSNVGLVPLLNFKLKFMPSDKFHLALEGDALAAPQGRAEDILFDLQYNHSRHFGINFGYRLLEGGANVDEVYNFAYLHYLIVGFQVKLK